MFIPLWALVMIGAVVAWLLLQVLTEGSRLSAATRRRIGLAGRLDGDFPRVALPGLVRVHDPSIQGVGGERVDLLAGR